MKKLFVAAAIILAVPCYTSITHANLLLPPAQENNITAEQLNDIIYDSFYKYVSRNTPFFEQDHGIQTKIANNNVGGILELFFEALARKTDHEDSYDSSAHREIEGLKKSEEALKQQVATLSSKVEMLTTHVTNVNDALKDNKALQAQQKYGGKK